MTFAPYQWRAGTGYIPPKDSVPMAVAPVYQSYACPLPAPPTYAHWLVQPPCQPVIAAKPPAPKKEKKCCDPPAPLPASTVVSKASSEPKTIVKCGDWRMAGKYTGKITVEIPPPPPKSEAPTKKKKKCDKPKKKTVCIPPPPLPSCSISPSDSISAHSASGSGTEITLASNSKEKSNNKKKQPASSSSSKCCTSKTTTTEITITSSKKPAKPLQFLKGLRGGGGCDTPAAAATTSEAPTACPTILPGVNYMFPRKKEHTLLHIFNKAAPVWEAKYQGQNMAFKMFQVTTKFSVRDVVERVLRKGESEEERKECEGWGVTECHEQGGGCWKKGTTIAYSSDKAAGSLGSMGWDAKRGKERGPVWLVVHKV